MKLWRIVILACVFAVVALVILRRNPQAELAKRIEALHAAGYPTTLTQLNQWYQTPPPGQNAGETISTAISYFTTNDLSKADNLPLFDANRSLPPRTYPLDEETQAVIRELIDDNAKVLELLDMAARQEGCRYPVDLTDGYSTLMPHIREFGKPLYLLCLKAFTEAQSGRPSEAVETLATAMAIANTLTKEPITVSQIWYRNHQSTVVSVAERIVNLSTPDTATLERLETILSTAYDPNALICGLIGEQCIAITAIRDPDAAGLYLDPVKSTFGPSGVEMRIAHTFGRADRFMIRCLALNQRHIDVLRLPPAKRLDAMQKLEPKVTQLREEFEVLSFFAPHLWGYVLTDLESWTRFRVACTALAIERYRQDKDALPDGLDALVPDYLDTIPMDPFDGQPLRYQKLDPGYMVYSIGKDLSDDQGIEGPRPQKDEDRQTKYDVTFVVER